MADIDPSLAVMGLPVMGVPDYVPPTEPLIELYKDRGDVDVIHLVVLRPYVPSGNS
nr:hypothetical protein [uncultured Dongia sp.]